MSALERKIGDHDRQLKEHAKDIAELKRASQESAAAMKRLEACIEDTRKRIIKLKG